MRYTAGIGMLSATLFIFRIELLQGIGGYLIRPDENCRADALYVLGGASLDRGSHAAGLLHAGCAPIAFCTGENVPGSYKAEGRMVTEADLSRSAALRSGADPGRILPFPYGTSTWEEAAGILYHAQRQGYDTVSILTTEFHTRRVGKVFRQRLSDSGIVVQVLAAPSSEYDPARWWTSEEGLLMVNNEYVKTLYYAITY